jgi:rubredoxin
MNDATLYKCNFNCTRCGYVFDDLEKTMNANVLLEWVLISNSWSASDAALLCPDCKKSYEKWLKEDHNVGRDLRR